MYTLALSRPKELPKSYPLTLVTIGDHIRKKRIDLGLFQRQVAEIIGVCEHTIHGWENGTEPELVHIPKIIEFLGYVPFDPPDSDDPLERLRYYKMLNGLSYMRLGMLIGKHHEQLEDWLSGRIKPCKRNIQNIVEFLNETA